METTTFKLSKPLITHKGELHELTLKPATARLFINYGSPYTVSKDDMVTPDFKVLFSFVSDMTEIDILTLNDIAASDVILIFNTVMKMLSARPQNG